MNIISISPHFPRHFYQFCALLRERGMQVFGGGDCPWEGIGKSWRNALTDYRFVSSLWDYGAVYHAAAGYIFHYGHIDFVESENEYWLELEARIRTDFNITSVSGLEAMADMNRKSRMKAAYKQSGILQAFFRQKGIYGWMDFWGYDVDHDWPWWRKQIRYSLPWLLDGEEG
ncbi:MAG: hypothetical protein ACI3VN_11720 [Candidatus Onthomonas sp.]